MHGHGFGQKLIFCFECLQYASERGLSASRVINEIQSLYFFVI